MIHAVTQEHDYPRVIYTEMLVGKAVVKFQVDSPPQRHYKCGTTQH